MYVQVYYNLHKHCLSVQNRKGIVVSHTNSILIKDVKFFVSEAGRRRVIKEKRKNVHAKIRGIKIPLIDISQFNRRKIRYNPYRFKTFVYADDESPVLEANLVYVEGGNVFELT